MLGPVPQDSRGTGPKQGRGSGNRPITVFERSTDIVIDDCLLLQLHPSLPSYECKQCRDFRAQAEMILDELK